MNTLTPDEIEDKEIRAVFEQWEGLGLVEFHHIERTCLDTYYFFRYRDCGGRWKGTMMTGDEIRASARGGR